MNNAEIIGSTDLIILLEDEIFADFFNTFLSLPVFGQTPFYTVDNARWSLWPELPHDLISKCKGLLTWLRKYRLPFFCKTSLCLYYILCQEFISFINSPEGAKMMRWEKADQWLLQKCIGGVRGMWRFCTYVKGSAGEELVDFWILAEKILSIDEKDVELRDDYLSLLLVLKATHLQEGSAVVTLCDVNIKSLLNLPIWHPNQSTTRREILSYMKKVALFKLQSYWLPNFYTHAKAMIAKEESCQGLMQEYETRLCSICCTHRGHRLSMSVKMSHHPQKWYSSKKTKQKVWQVTDHTSWSPEFDSKPDINSIPSQESCPQKKVIIQEPFLKNSSSKVRITSSLKQDTLCARMSDMKKGAKSYLHMEGLFETKLSAYLRTATPIISHSPQIIIKKARQSLTLGYTHWALRADSCAGGPFRDHLRKLNLKVEVQLLDLWQELHHFLNSLIRNRKTGNVTFWQMLGNRICELYLNEEIGPCLPLKPQTTEGLKELLPYGYINPWIPRAQNEICQMLRPWYDEFLDEEDYWFLAFSTHTKYTSTKWHKRDSISNEENILLYKRLEESLELSTGLDNMKAMEFIEWQKIATEDLRQDGSLQVELKSPVFAEDIEKMSFEELCWKHPKVAIEKISDDYKIYCQKAPKIDFTKEIFRRSRRHTALCKKTSIVKKVPLVKKPSLRPRNLSEVLLNTNHLEAFMEFLKERHADSILQFLVAVQKISIETDEIIHESLVENIIKTFFHGKVPPEEVLQCNAPIIREISQMRSVSTASLFALQSIVMKSLEENWFNSYQQLFPALPPKVQTETQRSPRKPWKAAASYLQHAQKKVWMKMISLIRSFCKYHRCMSNISIRQEFEEFLHMEIHDKENFSLPPNAATRPSPYHPSVRAADENGDTILMKRRIFGHKTIIVNFIINDFYFFSEMEKFNDLVRSSLVLQVNRAYNKNDVILMRSKINVILKLYLQSDIPPKLRVNISEYQRDAILAAVTEGHLDQSVFHGAIVSLFPIIMYFWKRFCSWKATCSYFQYREKTSSDRKTSPKSLHQCPSWSGGDQAILRFSLNGGVEWFQPSQQDVGASLVLNYKNYLAPKGRRNNLVRPPDRGISSPRSLLTDRSFSGLT